MKKKSLYNGSASYVIADDSIVYINPYLRAFESFRNKEGQNEHVGLDDDEEMKELMRSKKVFIASHQSKNKKNNFFSLTGNDIKYELANLKQLTLEITDTCNLRCKYCTYGDLYENYDERIDQYMNFDDIKILIDYLVDLWNSSLNISVNTNIYISFYGGEPLINMHFIEEIVLYISSKKLLYNKIIFSITTNGVLLKKYIKYLVENDFKILISFDGNKYNNSYRIFKNGVNSFDRVFENIQFIMVNYPQYFQSNVNFNSVLHNRNSVSDTYNYIKTEFNKTPRVNELNSTGVKFVKVEEFNQMYKNITESLYQSNEHELIKEEMFVNLIEIIEISLFIYKYSGNYFQNYNDLLQLNNKGIRSTPTGTCFPFSKKMFVSVTGKIYPCERIGSQFELGVVKNNQINIDFDCIAVKYNNYYNKLMPQCSSCYNLDYCTQCIYNLKDIDDFHPTCRGYSNENDFQNKIVKYMDYIGKNRNIYNRIINELCIRF